MRVSDLRKFRRSLHRPNASFILPIKNSASPISESFTPAGVRPTPFKYRFPVPAGMSEYFQLERTKMMINARSDISDDLIMQLGASASRDMRNYLLSLTENIPTGDAITDDIFNAVSYAVVARYLATVSDYDGYRSWKAEYDDAKESIRTAIQLAARSNIMSIRPFGRGDV